MNVLTILKNELKLMLRNRINLILLLVMPIAMVGLMGYALKPFFNVEEKGIEKFNLLYINKDNGYVGKSIDEFIRGEGNLYFNIVEAESQDLENEMAEKGIDEAVIIPEGMSEKLSSGEEASLLHISTGKDIIKNSVVESFLGGFKDSANEAMAVESVINSYKLQGINAAAIQGDVTGKYGTDFVNLKEVSKAETTKLGSFQYFSVSMLIFFLLTSGMGLGMGIVDDRTEKLYSRITSHPVTNNQYLLGKTLGNGIIGFVQAALVIIFTSLVFKVDWGSNYLGIAIVVITVLFSSSGLAVILSSLINSSKALSTALIVIYWSITFISGAFAPIPAFDSIGRFTLNKWAFEAITSFMAGKGIVYAANYLLMLAALCVILWLAGIMLYRRRAVNE